MNINVNFYPSGNQNIIWNKLAERLGRQPTDAEASAEVKRIMQDVMVDLAGDGKLSWQKK